MTGRRTPLLVRLPGLQTIAGVRYLPARGAECGCVQPFTRTVFEDNATASCGGLFGSRGVARNDCVSKLVDKVLRTHRAQEALSRGLPFHSLSLLIL